MFLKKDKWKNVRHICETFYCNNHYLTPYQSWDFLNTVGKGFQLKKPFNSLMYSLYTFVLFDNEGARCVLPLEINRASKKIRMRGFCSSIGHLDFIYPKDFKKEEFDEMLFLLAKEFENYVFIFDRISEKSLTFKFFNDRKNVNFVESECVSIPLRDSWEDWLQLETGPKTRKHIKKAYRDLEKDGFRVSLVLNHIDNQLKKNEWNDMCKLFAKRSCVHNNINGFWWPLIYLLKRNDPIAKALYNSEYRLSTRLFFNDTLVAFGSGTRSNDGRFISMRHAVDMKFKQYQIGLIYTSEVIKALILNRDILGVKEFDRSRGAEQHKVGVGGVIHKNFEWNYLLVNNDENISV